MTPEQVILKICRAAPHGVMWDTLKANTPEIGMVDHNLVMLKLLRLGKIWVHAGRYYTKAHYDRATVEYREAEQAKMDKAVTEYLKKQLEGRPGNRVTSPEKRVDSE
jgi:hypothetical protein